MLTVTVVSLCVLIALSAFFSGSETALIGSSGVRLHHMAASGSRGADRVLKMLRQPSELLGTILVGNNLVNVMAAALTTTLIGPVYATVVITIVLLVCAEVTPKTLAASRPEYYATKVAAPIQGLTALLRPVVWAMTAVTKLLLNPFLGRGAGQEQRLSRQELLTAISLGAREGELEPSETRMAREVLALKDKPVRRIMIPLEDVAGIPESATFRQVEEEFVRSGFTRYPVYRAEKSEMVGMLLVKDLLINREEVGGNWLQYVRPLMSCRADLEADELLRDMQIQRSHMAGVEDEQGRFVGLVTMEDVLEEIVGEIQDESDPQAELIRELSEDRFTVRGDAEVDDLCKVINVDLGDRDQHIRLSEWFSRRASGGQGKVRWVKLNNAQVVHRGRNRYEVWIRNPDARTTASEDYSGMI
ncbi:MAG: hemolysin family protein [Planctomycetota bacterium]